MNMFYVRNSNDHVLATIDFVDEDVLNLLKEGYKFSVEPQFSMNGTLIGLMFIKATKPPKVKHYLTADNTKLINPQCAVCQTLTTMPPDENSYPCHRCHIFHSDTTPCLTVVSHGVTGKEVPNG